MIPIPRHITLIIINENDKFSDNQYDQSYDAGEVDEEGYVHEYTGEEPFCGPVVCHCGVGCVEASVGNLRWVGCELDSREDDECGVVGYLVLATLV